MILALIYLLASTLFHILQGVLEGQEENSNFGILFDDKISQLIHTQERECI